jgi:hypothetical protein
MVPRACARAAIKLGEMLLLFDLIASTGDAHAAAAVVGKHYVEYCVAQRHLIRDAHLQKSRDAQRGQHSSSEHVSTVIASIDTRPTTSHATLVRRSPTPVCIITLQLAAPPTPLEKARENPSA